jgi:hypothetical protein
MIIMIIKVKNDNNGMIMIKNNKNDNKEEV